MKTFEIGDRVIVRRRKGSVHHWPDETAGIIQPSQSEHYYRVRAEPTLHPSTQLVLPRDIVLLETNEIVGPEDF